MGLAKQNIYPLKKDVWPGRKKVLNIPIKLLLFLVNTDPGEREAIDGQKKSLYGDIMAVVIDENLKVKLEKIEKRSWWPVTLLAEILGKPKKYIYRKIDDEKFDIIEDSGTKKISSDSVIKYFESRHKIV